MDADFPNWINAVRHFTGLHGLQCGGYNPVGMGYVSHLAVPDGRITYLHWSSSLALESSAEPMVGVLLYWHGDTGTAQVMTGASSDSHKILLSSAGSYYSEPHNNEGVEVAYLQFEPHELAALPSDYEVPEGVGRFLSQAVQQYFELARYFPDYKTARETTQTLLATVKQALLTGVCESGLCPVPVPDSRVCRVMSHIEDSSQWQYDLKELIRVALTSERNLYILMKKHTGQTPYQYHLRTKLILVRNGLISGRAEDASISWHAINKGFSHLGRFSAQYREHFGELPSETVAWCKALEQSNAAPARNMSSSKSR